MAIKLLSKITLVGKKVLVDKAFCYEEIRDYIYKQKAVACFQRIKNFRHIATRYDKLSICFLNFVTLAAVMIQI